jgi:hypothetical protein
MPTIRVEPIQRKIYPPAGKCIYCGSTIYSEKQPDRDLGEEHIIPRSIGGRHVLPLASCMKCEGVTSAFETECANTIFAPAKAFVGIPSRKSNRIMGKIPSLTRTIGDTGAFGKVKIPTEEHYGLLMLPIFSEPVWASGIDRGDTISIRGFSFRSFVPDGIRRLQRQNREAGSLLNPTKFCLLLSKIAHAHLKAEQLEGKISDFTPLLIDRVGNFNAPFAYVGTSRFKSDSESMMHKIQHQVLSSVRRRTLFIEVSIQLFGGPTYLVAAGTLPESSH